MLALLFTLLSVVGLCFTAVLGIWSGTTGHPLNDKGADAVIIAFVAFGVCAVAGSVLFLIWVQARNAEDVDIARLKSSIDRFKSGGCQRFEARAIMRANRMLHSDRYVQRNWAVRLLITYGHPALVAPLLAHPDKLVRMKAQAALTRSRNTTADVVAPGYSAVRL